MLALVFLSVCMDSCGCACLPQRVCMDFCVRLRFSVCVAGLLCFGDFVPRYCIDSYKSLFWRFSVFEWTLVSALNAAFLNVCMHGLSKLHNLSLITIINHIL